MPLPISRRAYLPRYPDGATPAAAVPRPASRDPRDYGVVINSATNSATLTANTAAFQAFVNDVATNGLRGSLPAGTININAAITVPARPGWELTGAGRLVTVIKQWTDNVPILNVGPGAGTMHGYKLGSFNLAYANNQPVTNAAATPILLSTMAFNGRWENINFANGFYAVKVATGVGCPWGTSFDDLMFGGQLTGGAMDWSQGVNGVPNNHWGRFTVDCTNAAGPVFAGIRGYNFRIDTIEFLAANQGPTLLQFAAGASVSIGTLKIEVSTWAAGRSVFEFQQNNFASIDEIYFAGSNPTVNALPAGQNLTLVSTSSSTGNAGLVKIGRIHADNFSSVTGSGSAYLVKAGSGAPVVVDKVDYDTNWSLTNVGSDASAEYVTVRNYLNGRLSQDRGDADYTVALGDPNISTFATPFTSPRTITLPSANADLHNGLYYEMTFNGAINGANTAVIKCGATTLRTQTTDGVTLRWTYRRHPSSAASGWVLTTNQPTNPAAAASGAAAGLALALGGI
jgi:hypothetical protein